MSSPVKEVSPPWGSLPVEVYILQNWDVSSSETPAEQRRELVQAFLQTGPHNKSTLPPVTPSQDQIESILIPWRTMFQREVANDQGQIGCVWLRTDYSKEGEPTHELLLENVDLYNAVDDEDRFLNDEELYNFGDDWRRILDVMPELVGYNFESWQLKQGRLKEAEDNLVNAKAYLAGDDMHGQSFEWIDRLQNDLPGTPIEVHKVILQWLRSSVHENCVVNYLIVEDKTALETAQVLLVFLDGKGRVVRQSRIGPSEAEEMGGFWLQQSCYGVHEWTDGEIGEDYQEDGVCGHLLHM